MPDIDLFHISSDLRTIEIPEGWVAGVFNDKDVNTVTFEVARYYKGIDLYLYSPRINYLNALGQKDTYYTTMRLYNESTLRFDWLLGQNCFTKEGTLTFNACLRYMDDNSTVLNEFNTTPAVATVLKGLENDTPLTEEQKTDLIDQFEKAKALAVSSAQSAEEAMNAAKKSEASAADSAKSAFSGTPEGYQALVTQVAAKVDGGYVNDDGYLILTSGGEPVGDPLGPFKGSGGGGGGGSDNTAKMSLKNTTGWLSNTIAQDSDCNVSMTWSSTEDDIATGDGTLNIRVNSALRLTKTVKQGTLTLNLKDYISEGSNSVRISVQDAYGNTRSLIFSIVVVAAYITSNFDASIPFSDAITFTYTPVGNIEKTIHFEVDGIEIGNERTTYSGRQLSYDIPKQKHGAHSLKVYFTGTINEQTVKSNELYYELICTEEGNMTPIIVSNYRIADSMEQYSNISITYRVYNPESATATVKLLVNDKEVSTQTVDRTEQNWTYRATAVGALKLSVSTENNTDIAKKDWSTTITQSDIDVKAETENLQLYLSSYGRSNNEGNPATWAYKDVTPTFTGFNWKSDGWVLDDDNISVLRLSGNSRVEIPFKPFASDFRTTGETIELEFATRDVMNYDSVIMSCMSGNRGFEITAQKAMLKSEQSEISTQFKENEHVRIAFVVQKRSENRLVEIYINGIMSGAIQYPDNDDFSQVAPVNITMGSGEVTTDVYCIRIYNNDLTRYQVLDNWIADSQNVEDMVNRYNRNNVYDAYGNIVIADLPSDLPYMILSASQLPQYKGDKKTCSVTYVDPVNASKSFTASGVQIDVQGTSSQYYARKNYKIKLKNGIDMTQSGDHLSKYELRDGAIPESTFCLKADVASSEGANNVELVRLYNDACTYKTPAQQENSAVRQGIDGFPMVVFWDDGTNTTFIGKYNFNLDKSDESSFGFVDGDESWEILNNTSQRVLWKSDDFSGDGWLNDFEARYPDTDPAYTDPTQLQAFATFVKSTDTEQATNETLASPVTYGDTTYTTDSPEYRLAKFKNEVGNYVEIESSEFYYIFTEMFLMVDSRAKNAFPSFMGSEVNNG